MFENLVNQSKAPSQVGGPAQSHSATESRAT